MPNHIKNVLTIHGTKEEVKQVYDRFSTYHEAEPRTSYDGSEQYNNKEKDYGWLDVKTNVFTRRNQDDVIGVPEGYERSFEPEFTRFPDFNKIIERPEALDITSDGFLMPLENRFSEEEPFKKTLDNLRESINGNSGMTEKGKKERVSNFMQGVANYIEYGHATWYGWTRANWGTKWNAYDFETIDDNTFSFETAWSGVPDLMLRISLFFPTIKFTYKYSDEDTGCNCGVYELENGIVSEYIPENSSKEAYELAFELRPEYAENFVLVGDTYQWKDEEELA